jgi:exonuclease VII small subunit
MNSIVERLKQLNIELEEAISYEDMDDVEKVRQELIFIIEDLESDIPFHSEDF